jgi:hypothetical protein
MAALFDAIALRFWVEFMTTGTVYDGKHGLTFLGMSATGHLISASLGATVCTYYAAKSLLRARRDAGEGA